MSSSAYGFLFNKDLPSDDEIVALCQKAGYDRTGIPLLDQSSQSVIAWIKYGPNAVIAEARTQDWTAKALGDNPASVLRVPRVYHAFTRPRRYLIGYIVMEYIDAPDCDSGDVQLVAKAVQTLIDLPAPDAVLGHVGGGSLVHPFFLDWIPILEYKTVKDLNDHINNILKVMEDPRRVDIVADASSGLRLCPCDINPGNFKKYSNGQVVALDFRATCFMPPCFFGVAIQRICDTFPRMVAQHVVYPQSDDVEAIAAVSGYIVPFGPRAVAPPRGLQKRSGP